MQCADKFVYVVDYNAALWQIKIIKKIGENVQHLRNSPNTYKYTYIPPT